MATLDPAFLDMLAARYKADALLAGERALRAVSCDCRDAAMSKTAALHAEAAKARKQAARARRTLARKGA